MNVERIDAARARDHIEMVDRILAECHPRLCSGGEHFVVWGIGSAYVPVIFQLVDRGTVPSAALWSVPVVLAACAVFSVLRGRLTRRMLQRSSLLQREFFNVLWITLGLAFVVNVAVYRIFSGAAAAAIWSVAEAIVLLYIGMHGNRRARTCGVLMVVSLIVANFAPTPVVGYVLGAGMLVGYAGFGASELLARE
jgi:MFS family permease